MDVEAHGHRETEMMKVILRGFVGIVAIAFVLAWLTGCDFGAQTRNYESKALGLFFKYPAGWKVFEDDQSVRIVSNYNLAPEDAANFEEGEGIILLFVFDAADFVDLDDPISYLDGFASIGARLGPPQKEKTHLVTLNGKEFAIGGYDITIPGPTYPNFIAARLTDQKNILAVTFTSVKNEPEFRMIFESILGSLKTSEPVSTITPTGIPVATTLISFQGVPKAIAVDDIHIY